MSKRVSPTDRLQAGFGRSVEVDDSFGPEVHTDLVARTITELGLADQPALIGAHSLGCLIAIELAQRHPDLVAGIVAFSPPLYPDEADEVTVPIHLVAGSDDDVVTGRSYANWPSVTATSAFRCGPKPGTS